MSNFVAAPLYHLPTPAGALLSNVKQVAPLIEAQRALQRRAGKEKVLPRADAVPSEVSLPRPCGGVRQACFLRPSHSAPPPLYFHDEHVFAPCVLLLHPEGATFSPRVCSPLLES